MLGMAVNKHTYGDPRSFFYYKGDYYINGTEIILTDAYINSHTWNGRKLWKYARYDHQVVYNGSVAYFFCIHKADWLSLLDMGLRAGDADDYAPYFVVQALDIDWAIKEFIRPIMLKKEQTEAIKEAITTPKRDFDNSGLVLLWVVYIVVMIISLIFRHYYLIWIAASIIFFNLRKEILKQ